MFASCKTRDRPYSSLSGPKIKGPMATLVYQ